MSCRIELLTIFALSCLAGVGRALVHIPVAETADNAIFVDEFDGQSLDRNKWNVVLTGFVYNREEQAYVDSTETVYISHEADAAGTDGVLVIHPRYRAGYETPEGRKFDFISGRINTRDKFDFTYGKAAARIKLPDAVGVWPAWWALGKGNWPETGEIDIMEYVGERDWTGVAIHGPKYSGETPLVNKYFFSSPDSVTDWHVYSVEWTPQQFLFRIDDRLIYRVTRPMIEHYGEWAFDTPKFLILNFALGGVYPYKTNGIESPYLGMPDDTVQRIKKDEVKMLVDWVRVTQLDAEKKK